MPLALELTQRQAGQTIRVLGLALDSSYLPAHGRVGNGTSLIKRNLTRFVCARHTNTTAGWGDMMDEVESAFEVQKVLHS